MVFDGEMPPYVPWQMGFALEAREKLLAHFGVDDLTPILQNHSTGLGSGVGNSHDLGDDRLRDVFGVIWNRKIEKDIGDVENCMLPESTLAGCTFPDPEAERDLADIPDKPASSPTDSGLFHRALAVRAGVLIEMYGLAQKPPSTCPSTVRRCGRGV